MLSFTCEKAILQNAVSIVSRTVSTKSSIPALEGIYMRGTSNLSLSGYNMQTGIRTEIEADIQQEGELVVNAHMFNEIIRKLPDDMVVFTSTDKFLIHVSCGDTNYDIVGMSANDYPELPEVDDEYRFSIKQSTLKAMINETSFAIGTNEARPIHTGSLFEVTLSDLTIVSVDGFRLALRKEDIEKCDNGSFRFVAPGAALREVVNICNDTDEIISIIEGKRHLMFETNSTQLICRRLEGEFLDYKNAVPKCNPVVVNVETKNMIYSLDRISVVITDKVKSPVKCTFDDGRVYMFAKTGNGEAKDICLIEGNGNKLDIGFNNHYLMEAMKYAPADKVKMEMNTAISPCIITPIDDSGKFLYMVLPVRLKAN